ncbi:MAG TPA: hypothetical protein VFH47_04690, partial [Candidatus Thermoplasmatota archaeon]|nr:hypothetical protein [Candidatus Thermoplasmatota archaeon]
MVDLRVGVVLALLAALLAAGAASAHGAVTSGEGPGYDGLGRLPGMEEARFRGPEFTLIEDRACPNASSIDGTPGNGHIGHIARVINLRAPDEALDGILDNSVDLYHLQSPYENQHAIEKSSNAGTPPPEAIVDSAQDGDVGGLFDTSVMLGADGYLRAALQSPLVDLPGPDLRLIDVHENLAYCIYAAPAVEGPWYFIDSTWNDGEGGNQANKDLADFATPLYQQDHGTMPKFTHILFIASIFDD